MKINDLLMDQVKAYVTLTIELLSITKPVQMLLLAENIGKYPLQDLNSAARATRLVRKFSLKFLEGRCLFSQDTIQDEQSPKLAETFSNKSHPRDKTGKKLISRDFLASDCRQQLFDHDSCESGSAGSSLPLSSIFDRLELYIE